MVEPLSRRLFDLLTELGICTAEQIHGCRGRVRRLTRDLPAFDTIWIDVLVQAGVLTRFQARTIEHEGPQALALGPCILIDRLGASHLSETFSARPASGGETVVVKRIRPTEEEARRVFERLQETVSRLTRSTSTSIVGPNRVLEHQRLLVTISRFVAGTSLSELQTRRGRFPPLVVWEMARQLAKALGDLEAAECLHGDIRLANVRLTWDGTAMLVDCGIAAAVSPEISIHQHLLPERCDVMAPERIGTRLPTSTRSDLYAFGCLLWQLLAGRPPFVSADPLSKLAHHQTSTIPDVRKWVPDAPPLLAEAILAMTSKEPAKRPRSFRDLSRAIGEPNVSGKRLLRRFHREYVSDAPRTIVAGRQVELNVTGRRKLMGGAAAVLMLLIGLVLLIPTFRRAAGGLAAPYLVRWENRLAPLREFWQESISTLPDQVAQETSDPILPLPAADATGVIRLKSGQTYTAAQRDVLGGPLTILGEMDADSEAGRSVAMDSRESEKTRKVDPRPTIVVDDGFSLRFSAESVTVENVRIEARGAASSGGVGQPVSSRHQSETEKSRQIVSTRGGEVKALLRVRSQELVLRNCEFVGAREPMTRNATKGTATEAAKGSLVGEAAVTGVCWDVLDPRDRSGRRLLLEGLQVFGCATALECLSPPRDLKVQNCLMAECLSMATFGGGTDSRQELQIQLDRVTLRDCESAVAWRISKPGERFGKVLVEPRDCVFDLKGDEAGFLRLEAAQLSQRDLQQFEIAGDGSLISPQAAAVFWKNPASENGRGLSAGQLVFDGLSRGPFRFRGPIRRDATNAAIVSFEGPRRGNELPGFIPSAAAPLVPASDAFPPRELPETGEKIERRLAN